MTKHNQTPAGANLKFCRTLKCYNAPKFVVWIPERKGPHRGRDAVGRVQAKVINEPWRGYFCHQHLTAALDIKLLALKDEDRIVIQLIDAVL